MHVSWGNRMWGLIAGNGTDLAEELLTVYSRSRSMENGGEEDDDRWREDGGVRNSPYSEWKIDWFPKFPIIDLYLFHFNLQDMNGLAWTTKALDAWDARAPNLFQLSSSSTLLCASGEQLHQPVDESSPDNIIFGLSTRIETDLVRNPIPIKLQSRFIFLQQIGENRI